MSRHSNSKDHGFKGTTYDQKFTKGSIDKKESNNLKNNFSLKAAFRGENNYGSISGSRSKDF